MRFIAILTVALFALGNSGAMAASDCRDPDNLFLSWQEKEESTVFEETATFALDIENDTVTNCQTGVTWVANYRNTNDTAFAISDNNGTTRYLYQQAGWFGDEWTGEDGVQHRLTHPATSRWITAVALPGLAVTE